MDSKSLKKNNQNNLVQPKSGINFVLYNSRFDVVEENTGYLPVEDHINAIQNLATDKLVMTKAGYIEIFVNNEAQTPVYYDNMQVIMRSGNVTEINAYYPYGKIITNLSSSALPAEKNFYKYNAKELQTVLNLQWLDYGARMMDGSRWFVPDPLSEKYYYISPYAFCANNPMKYIDSDGREVKIYYAKTNAGAGFIAGVNASAYRGTAYDNYGVTHFSAYNIAVPNNLDNTRTPNLMIGAGGYLGGVGFQIDWTEKSFRNAFEKWNLSVSVGVGRKTGVVGTINMGATNENSADSFGIDVGFGGFGSKGSFGSGGDTHYNESISVSHGEAKVIGSYSRWHVDNKEAIYDKNGNITGYSGVVFSKNIFGKSSNTGVRVQSGIRQTDDGIQSDNIWTSRIYELERLSDW